MKAQSYLFLFICLLFAQKNISQNQLEFRSDPVNFNPLWAPFLHGVASGDPSENSVILWTRVTPDSTVMGNSIDVEWTIADDPNLENVIQSGMAEVLLDKDFTLKLTVTGLEAGSTYYYGFEALGKHSLTGKTKTTPTNPNHLKFGVINCANFQTGYFNAYHRLADHNDLDAIIFLGDFFYEYGDGVVANSAIVADRPIEPAHEIVTLDDYRLRYSTYHLDTNLIRLLQQYPLIAVWDDHEFANNAWIGGSTNHNPATEGPWVDRKAAAHQAFFEWTPVTDHPENHIQRSIRYGDLAEIIMLDTRIVGREEPFASILDPGVSDPDRTILGTDQKTWLKEQILNSEAQWKILGNQVIFSKFSMGWLTMLAPVQSFYQYESQFLDGWKGFPAEQQEILDFLSDNNINNTVFLSGDIHTAFALDVPNTPNTFELIDTSTLAMVPIYTPSPGYDPETGEGSLAVEMIVQSTTSSNFDEQFDPFTANFLQSFISSDIVFQDTIHLGNPNPHLKYSNLIDHGYFILDIKPDSVQGNWYYTPILEITDEQTFGEAWYTLDGENHLQQAANDSAPKAVQDIPAPPNPPGLTNVKEATGKNNPINLLGLYPNPFSDFQTLHFAVNQKSFVNITLVNEKGQVVNTLVKNNLPAGVYDLKLKGDDLVPGIYFYRIQTEESVKVLKTIKSNY